MGHKLLLKALWDLCESFCGALATSRSAEQNVSHFCKPQKPSHLYVSYASCQHLHNLCHIVIRLHVFELNFMLGITAITSSLFSFNTSAHLSTNLLHISATICTKTSELTRVLSHLPVLVVTHCNKSPGPMDRLGFQVEQRQRREQSRRVQRWEAIWWLSGPDKNYYSWPASGPRGPLGSIQRTGASSWRAISEAPESESSCCDRRRDGWVDGWIQLVGRNRVEPGLEGMLLSMEEWKATFQTSVTVTV